MQPLIPPMEQHNNILTGHVERFLFKSAENDFAIFILAHDGQSTVVRGSLCNIQIGQEISVSGQWTIHPKFGKQFEATSCVVTLPATVVGLKKYLGSGLIKGIGPTYAEKIVDMFGTEILKILDERPHHLLRVEGIGEKRLATIIEAWKTQKSIASLMVFLQERGITPACATKLYRHYKDATIDVLTENPYRLADEVWGIGFKLADDIAQKMGFLKTSPHRIAAGITFTLTVASSQGHVYIEEQHLKNQARTLLELADEHTALVESACAALREKNKIVAITLEQKTLIALATHAACEHAIAQHCTRLMHHSSALTAIVDRVYHTLRAAEKTTLALTEDQERGIMAAFTSKISIITGGPGTGKTTLVKKLIDLCAQEKIRYKLAAPTGRAAKRITESTGRFAATIHRLLEFEPQSKSFVHNEKNALPIDILIIDEASMVDIFLAHAVLRAVPHAAHIVFIGDCDQLPSVGPGNVLNDLILSNRIPTTHLNKIFRQAHDSLIIINAHRVNRGEFPTSAIPDARRDFFFIKEEDPAHVMKHVARIFSSELKKQGLLPRDAQLLTPMNRGAAGTITLNGALQELLNSGEKPELIVNGIRFKVGDQVMQIRNNYDKIVFNGDIGSIADIEKEDRTLTVQFGERRVVYESDELLELVLAYAITIHKSQGSEYPAVIIPIFTQHFTLLQKNLLYTAITRAKKVCFLIGQTKAIAIALRTKGAVRTTLLSHYLREAICS